MGGLRRTSEEEGPPSPWNKSHWDQSWTSPWNQSHWDQSLTYVESIATGLITGLTITGRTVESIATGLIIGLFQLAVTTMQVVKDFMSLIWTVWLPAFDWWKKADPNIQVTLLV